MGLKLRIEDKETWLKVMVALLKGGMLSNISVKDLALVDDDFPVDVELRIDNLEGLLRNPILKPFKGKIDSLLTEQVAKVIS